MHKIQKIVIIRHGNYGANGRITDLGRRQMLYMVGQIKSHTGAGSEGVALRIVSSSAPHAIDSAKVLENELAAPTVEVFDALWSNDSAEHAQDNDRAIEIVRQQSIGVDVLIVVTHCEYARDLPEAYCQAVFSLPSTGSPNREIVEGQCAIISCTEKTYSIIP